MPKIHRRSDGGYYTRTKVENSFITYQIKLKGIEILKAYGERDVLKLLSFYELNS